MAKQLVVLLFGIFVACGENFMLFLAAMHEMAAESVLLVCCSNYLGKITKLL